MLTQLGVIIFILFLTIFIGAPVSFSLCFTAIIATLIYLEPSQLLQIGSIAFSKATDMNQLIAPLFILMAEFLARGDVAADIFTILNKYLQRIKGGLAVSATLASTIFAALCGSSVATAAAIGRVSIAQMIRRGYQPAFAAGTVAAGGTLGIMIPPSIPFVIFGIITETSIAKLLIAGILPGLMLSGIMIVSILIRTRLNPSLVNYQAAGEAAEPSGEKGAVLATAVDPLETAPKTSFSKDLVILLPAGLLILLVLGSLYTGLATPMESAGFGAVGALVLVLCLRRLKRNVFAETLKAATKTSTMILFVVICAMTLTYVVSYLGIAQALSDAIVGIGVNKWVVIILLYALWFIMGCLLDPGSMISLTIPFIFPTLVNLGFDPIWIGVVSTLCIEIGMITPPVGFNLFVIRSITDVPIKEIILGVLPYVVILVIALAILTIFPQIALFLPSKM